MTLAAALDTNILVRWIVRDDDEQTLIVGKLLAKHVNQHSSLFVPITVALELEWVLRSRYKFKKPEVMSALSALLMTFELVFESEGALEQALATYEDSRGADFAECLHLALATKEKALPFLTFDVAAANEEGAKLLK